jgi:hypothetical protein
MTDVRFVPKADIVASETDGARQKVQRVTSYSVAK